MKEAVKKAQLKKEITMKRTKKKIQAVFTLLLLAMLTLPVAAGLKDIENLNTKEV